MDLLLWSGIVFETGVLPIEEAIIQWAMAEGVGCHTLKKAPDKTTNNPKNDITSSD